MKVSIITCTWDSEPWIAQCIESVRNQDHDDIEHIFVDGGSTDGTLERIALLAGQSQVLHGIRGGISHAMNVGAQAASGELIAHLHGDDAYTGPQVVSRVVRAFERQPQALWLYGKCRYIIDGQMRDNDFVTRPYSLHALRRGNLIPHPAAFVRRSAFLDCGGFDTSCRYAMDYDLWLRLAAMGPPIQLDEYLAAFRFHENSRSTRNVWACHNEFLKVQFRHASRNPLEWAEYLARHVVRAGQMLLKSRHGPPGA